MDNQPPTSKTEALVSNVDPTFDSASGLDQVDLKLVRLLEQDGRMSYADLSEAVGLTPGGARARVKRLRERNVIQVIGVPSPAAVGLNSIASLQIEVSGDIDEIADTISQFEGVRYIVLGSGRFSMLVEVYAANHSELFSIINRKIRKVSGISRLETFVYDSVHTHEPFFPAKQQYGR
ncbi:Lrp/AsnC family transcriptional regulator [Leucobacter sp. cx-42]|uniref:Lrp/AsnC family transcriptional regulator n=1 Tax=unclassified Leucobacter TaxID=2621730 RepID=UPI00165E0AE3|nr:MULTISPECIES: Lrp/AsnC family transcriptional regulator [unclassified Leucobacter]MBC9953301.1 Lrp/AsnC family transcriptional regulator [Leucobacter sp. cx-42]